MKPRLVVATENPGKLGEFRELLRGQPIELCSLLDVGGVDFPEEGLDYRENAIAKAMAVTTQHGLPAIADDSGIEVRALGDAPGPLSARYGGEGLDDEGRVAKLLGALAATKGAGGIAGTDRSARFVCWAALTLPVEGAPSRTECVLGECRGSLLEAPAGEHGFGYDPVFTPSLAADDPDAGRSMAEIAAQRKNEISHRGRAFQALVQTSSWDALLAT